MERKLGRSRKKHQQLTKRPSDLKDLDSCTWADQKLDTTNRAFLSHGEISSSAILVMVIQIVVTVFMLLNAVVHSIVPKQRDSITQEYVNPSARFLESICLTDFLYRFNDSALFNRFVCLMMCHVLVVRFKGLLVKLSSSRANKHQYTKINVIQLIVGYLCWLQGDFSEWRRFILKSRQHQCEISSCLGGQRLKNMRILSDKLRAMSRIDRLYVFNQIEFCNCYQGFDLPSKEERRLLTDKSRTVLQQGLSKHIYFTKPSIFQTQIPYLARPEHLMSPTSLYNMTIMYIVLLPLSLLIANLIFIEICYLELMAHGLDLDQQWYPSWLSIVSTMRDRVSILRLAEAFVIVGLVLTSNYDSGLLLVSSVFCHSRTQKVLDLTGIQVSFLRNEAKRWADLDFDVDKTVYELPDSVETSYVDANFSLGKLDHLGVLKLESELYLNVMRRTTPTDRAIQELNANIRYILNLVQILCTELDDLKQYFTFYLNCSIFFGALGSTFLYDAMIRINTPSEMLITLLSCIIPTVPILAASILGATSEREVSNCPVGEGASDRDYKLTTNLWQYHIVSFGGYTEACFS